MDIQLFSTLLRNLFHANIMLTDDDIDVFLDFEKQYCFHPSLQPMYTASALSYLADSMLENTFYEIIDTLQICLLFFRFETHTFWIGPYVKEEFNESKMQSVLIKNQIPASYQLSLKLYYSTFPMLNSFHIQTTVTACMNAFCNGSIEFAYRRLHGFREQLDSHTLFEADSIDYTELYRRYDAENHFLKMIETGNTDEVLIALSQMTMPDKNSGQKFATSVYQNPMLSLSIMRALARKAAENGGASIIEIDEITQRAVQKMYASRNFNAQISYTNSMILELTEAVQKHRLQLKNYSTPIRKTVEYLNLNYSQDISLLRLADIVHFSPSHLSKAFKKETGITISQYLINMRCSRAAEMLKDTDLSIADISNYVGYPDNNYFVKIFKKQYGVTPTAFRKKDL